MHPYPDPGSILGVIGCVWTVSHCSLFIGTDSRCPWVSHNLVSSANRALSLCAVIRFHVLGGMLTGQNSPQIKKSRRRERRREREASTGWGMRNGTFSGNNKGTIIYQSLTSVNAVTALTNSGLINKYIHYIWHLGDFADAFIQSFRSQSHRATDSSSGAFRVRCLAQGHLNTHLGGAWDRTSNLLVTREPTLPPELLQLSKIPINGIHL